MNIKLADLEAQFLRTTPGGHVPEIEITAADGLMFICPKCRTHSVICWMPHVPQSVSPTGGRWDMWGSCVADVSMRPSVHLASTCGWHGFIGNGEASIL